MLKRLHGFCDVYKANCSFEGTVEDFDTMWYVDPERLARGMTVRTESETKFVEFRPKRKPPIEIGDHVIVTGLETGKEKKTVISAVLLIQLSVTCCFLRISGNGVSVIIFCGIHPK
ncbi:MAG: hypothetical protein E4H14_18590 [Candidatus Thorarchaeota archaeon]|nr:MAG: hypothetical protein E4H14_18590 [Candidatus Thorarchaeota archaeon]